MEAEAELDSIPTAAMPLPDSSAAYDAHLHTFNHHHPPTAATSALRTPSTASKQLAVFLSVVGVDLEGYTTTSVKARQVQQKSRTGFFGKIKRKVQDKVKQVAAGGAARPPSVGLCHIRSFVSDSEAHPFLTEEECYAGICARCCSSILTIPRARFMFWEPTRQATQPLQEQSQPNLVAVVVVAAAGVGG